MAIIPIRDLLRKQPAVAGINGLSSEVVLLQRTRGPAARGGTACSRSIPWERRWQVLSRDCKVDLHGLHADHEGPKREPGGGERAKRDVLQWRLGRKRGRGEVEIKGQ